MLTGGPPLLPGRSGPSCHLQATVSQWNQQFYFPSGNNIVYVDLTAKVGPSSAHLQPLPSPWAHTGPDPWAQAEGICLVFSSSQAQPSSAVFLPAEDSVDFLLGQGSAGKVGREPGLENVLHQQPVEEGCAFSS